MKIPSTLYNVDHICRIEYFPEVNDDIKFHNTIKFMGFITIFKGGYWSNSIGEWVGKDIPCTHFNNRGSINRHSYISIGFADGSTLNYWSNIEDRKAAEKLMMRIKDMLGNSISF